MSTNNICFRGGLRKISILFGYEKMPFLVYAVCLGMAVQINRVNMVQSYHFMSFLVHNLVNEQYPMFHNIDLSINRF